MLLIITATINPPSQDYLKINSIDERIRQYKDSLNYFIDSGAFGRIIFCDNSGYLSEMIFSGKRRRLPIKKILNLRFSLFPEIAKK